MVTTQPIPSHTHTSTLVRCCSIASYRIASLGFGLSLTQLPLGLSLGFPPQRDFQSLPQEWCLVRSGCAGVCVHHPVMACSKGCVPRLSPLLRRDLGLGQSLPWRNISQMSIWSGRRLYYVLLDRSVVTTSSDRSASQTIWSGLWRWDFQRMLSMQNYTISAANCLLRVVSDESQIGDERQTSIRHIN